MSDLVRLGREDRDDLVRMLARAFLDYPVMRYVLGAPLDGPPESSDYLQRLEALVGFFCDKRLARDWPILGARAGGEIAAAALLTPPGGGSLGEAQARTRLIAQVGEDALSRLDYYEEITDQDAPSRPHHTLGVLGVAPSRQGKGDGGRLLEEVARHAAADPASAGVYLNTEVEGNVGFYERFGFAVVGERDVGAMHCWCLFRDRAASG